MGNAKKSGKTAGEESTQQMYVPQEDFLKSLYAASQHWHADIKFFELELSFFSLLIDKHIALLIDRENIDQTHAMVSHVLSLDKERALLEDRISLHNQHLADLVENPFVQKTQDYNEEHAKLEGEISAFVKKFRTVKRGVFNLSEHVIRSEKMKRMIDLI